MGWKTFRDRVMVLGGLVVIPGLWVGAGLGYLALPGEVIGATIVVWTLSWNFYFRKAGPLE